MGHKVHPLGFRIGVIRDWQAKWYAHKHYAELLHEDLKLRQAIQTRYNEAGISLVETDHQSNKVMVTIHTARPGVVIGRGGQRVDEMRLYLEGLIGKKVQLNIQEIQQPELDAYLVARTVAEQIERRVAYRRAMKQAILRTLGAGAKGMRISCAGRLGGAEIARRQVMHQGQVPLHKLRADIDYGFTEARTTMGRIGIKTWIYKGDILPEPEAVEEELLAATEAATPAKEEKPAEPVAKVSTEAEAKPSPPARRKRKPAEPAAGVSIKAEPPAEEEKPAEPVAEVSTEAEAKPSPPARRKRKPAEPAAGVSIEAEEEKDATT